MSNCLYQLQNDQIYDLISFLTYKQIKTFNFTKQIKKCKKKTKFTQNEFINFII